MGKKIFLTLFVIPVMLKASDAPATLHIYPYLQNVSSSGIVIMWETTGPFIGEIQYGLDRLQLNMSMKESSAKKLHEIKLTGLLTGTTYFYRCLWNGEKTQIWQFKTAPTRDAEKIKIITYGDSRSNPEVHSQIARMVAAENPDLILHQGKPERWWMGPFGSHN
ncbi:hypothetical protein JW935_03425 [candidate division KSB1 bacterium]|nr:hypothetical protein [candidate division KSB1 bacterium]